MTRKIANMYPDKWEFFKDVFEVSSGIHWVDANHDKNLDPETELIQRGGLFDCGCGTCDISVGYWNRLLISNKLELMQSQLLFDETYVDAYRRLKTGRCKDGACTREEIKKGLEILGQTKNPRIVQAVERTFRHARLDNPKLTTLFVNWLASQSILLGDGAKAKKWILILEQVSEGSHPALTSLVAGVLNLYAQEQNIRQTQDLLENVPPFFAGNALFGLAAVDGCKNKEAAEQMTASYLEKHPYVPSAHAAKGYLAGLCFGAPREGMKAFNRALNLEVDRSKKADYFLMQGLIYARAKIYEKSLAKIEKAKELDAAPASQIKYHEIKAEIYKSQKRYFDAIGEYEACRMLAQEPLPYLSMIGEIYLEAQNFKAAKKTFEEVLLATAERKLVRSAEKGLLQAYKGLEHIYWRRQPPVP